MEFDKDFLDDIFPKQVSTKSDIGLNTITQGDCLDLLPYVTSGSIDMVLDNCCGSGTTGVACQNTQRNFIQFELSPEYCEIAKGRLV